MPSLLLRGTVAIGDALAPGAWVALRDGLIAGVGQGSPPAGFGAPLELGDQVIAPGFVDVHVHGGGGAQAAGDDPAEVADQVLRAARFHASHGTTCMVATTVSDTAQRLRATAAGVRIVTAEYRIAKRPAGRVPVDYNQNAWGKTLASVYSVRARPRATERLSRACTWRVRGWPATAAAPMTRRCCAGPIPPS